MPERPPFKKLPRNGDYEAVLISAQAADLSDGLQKANDERARTPVVAPEGSSSNDDVGRPDRLRGPIHLRKTFGAASEGVIKMGMELTPEELAGIQAAEERRKGKSGL